MPDTDIVNPRHLLLATDLSARCDRASDRALALARAWNAKLTVVHALDVVAIPSDNQPSVSDAAVRATRVLHADFGEVQDVPLSLRVGEGRPEDVVLDIASNQGCDLIITGIAGNDPFGQPLIGGTVTALARRAKVPVLVVKSRPRAAYRRVVVATDLSKASGCAIQTALKLFTPEQLTLFHAFDIPFANWVEDKIRNEREWHAAALREIRAFLADIVQKDVASTVSVRADHGDPAPTLAGHILSEDVDLVIAGTHGRTGLMNILLGSVASGILYEVPCDVMIVPSKGFREGA